jgi:mono/diheme cytochrome c family protein
MKRFMRLVGALVGLIVAVAGGLLLFVQIDGIPKYAVEKIDVRIEATPERLARGAKLASLLCAGCHANPTTGQFTGKHMTDVPKEFGEIFSRNITQHPDKGIGKWSDADIVYLLRTGVRPDGQYYPPWMTKLPNMSDEDIASVVSFLRSDDPRVAPANVDPPGVTRPSFLSKLLSHVAFKKLPYPEHAIVAPPKSDRVAYGEYLIKGLECYSCHSADFKTNDFGNPAKSAGYLGGGNPVLGLDGKAVPSANLTSDEATGIGRWSEPEFARALREGIRPDGHVLRYPMIAMSSLDDEEVSAIYAYLRSVPKIRNAVARAPYADAPAGSDGKALYLKYACFSCHGDKGVGVGDLRKANVDYPEDAQLRAWIQDAPAIRPGTVMPKFAGVIAEVDYAPLIRYVRELSNAAP